LPPSYNTFRTQLFGVDLSRLMGADGERGLPRVIVGAINYLRAEGTPKKTPLRIGLAVEGLFRIPPSQTSLQCAIAAYDRGHPVDLRDYGPHVSASLIKQFMGMLPMPILPAHIYPALTKFPSIAETEQTQFIQKNILGRLDPCAVILLAAVMGLLNGIRHSSQTNHRRVVGSNSNKDACIKSRDSHYINSSSPPP
jgi:RhoGAP domain